MQYCPKRPIKIRSKRIQFVPFWNKLPNMEFDKYLEFTSAQFYFNENGAQKPK